MSLKPYNYIRTKERPEIPIQMPQQTLISLQRTCTQLKDALERLQERVTKLESATLEETIDG